MTLLVEILLIAIIILTIVGLSLAIYILNVLAKCQAAYMEHKRLDHDIPIKYSSEEKPVEVWKIPNRGNLTGSADSFN